MQSLKCNKKISGKTFSKKITKIYRENELFYVIRITLYIFMNTRIGQVIDIGPETMETRLHGGWGWGKRGFGKDVMSRSTTVLDTRKKEFKVRNGSQRLCLVHSDSYLCSSYLIIMTKIIPNPFWLSNRTQSTTSDFLIDFQFVIREYYHVF